MKSEADPLAAVHSLNSVCFQGSERILESGRRAQYFTSSLVYCGLKAVTSASSSWVFTVLHVHHTTTVGSGLQYFCSLIGKM